METTTSTAEKTATCMTDDATGLDNRPETHNKVSHFEYETQHFGFTPISLLNGMFNAVCDLYREALKAFCRTCTEKYPTVMTEEELRQARSAVSARIDEDICLMFDTLESFLLHKVFTIPDDVVLPEDTCQIQRQEDNHADELAEKISDVKKRIIKVKYANAVLSQHLEDSQSLQSTFDTILDQMCESQSNVHQQGGKAMKDWISYYSELLKKVKSDP